jgi:hypothetical protein
MKPFLRWWLIISNTILGLGFLVVYDGINYINEADATKLSFVIFSLFVYGSIKVGLGTYKDQTALSFPRFLVSAMTKLGMVGTVIGFMMMLSTCLSNVNFQNVQSLQAVIGQMTSGMSTALVTTAAGLICSLILHLQIFNADLRGGRSA